REAGARRPRRGAPHRRPRSRPLRGGRRLAAAVPRARRDRRHLRAHARGRPAGRGAGARRAGRRPRTRAPARSRAAAGLRAAQDHDEPDPDQGGAQPARPRGRRVPPAAGAADRERARAGARLPRPARAARPGLGTWTPSRAFAVISAVGRGGDRRVPRAAPAGAPERAARMLGAMNDVLRVIPLGGLGEVGKNMTVYECAGETIVVDAGLAFPRDEHLGVDLVLPDFGYLRDRQIRAVVLTHAHEDHVGGLPYLLREARVAEIWATRLTLGLVSSKLDEHGLLRAAEQREIDPEGPPVELGPFRLEFVRMAHSVPDSVGIAIETAAGRVFHTGDWKLDHTPIDGLRTDVGRLAELGNRGVDLLLGDSTNAERPGFTQSERLVGEAFRQIIPARQGRVLISSFASNIHRMQQAIDIAGEVGRRVSVVGRSMRKNLNIARNLGYVQAPESLLARPAELEELDPGEQLILCTGSQGEPMSALTRIAYHDHPAVHVERGDTVIISARPVPGNELRVHDATNRLTRDGAEVLHEENAPVHVSGHARS